MRDRQGNEHWMIFEGGRDSAPGAHRARFESLGLHLPEGRLTTDELLASARHHPQIELEQLTGIHERRVCGENEDSFTLALGAARDCLAHSSVEAKDLELLVSCSISKNHPGLSHRSEPPFAVSLARELGAAGAVCFDVSNACAGMLTGVFVVNDFIRRGAIRRGMIVSGESISNLGRNAANEIRSVLSSQLASLTLGDAGVAALLERTDPDAPGIILAGFTTLSEHSRLCIGMPAKSAPGASMYTKARTIHRVAIEDSPGLLADALAQSGYDFDDIDWVIPHQTSVRAIRKGSKELAERLGAKPRHVVQNLALRGNTASTTHFVALYEMLERGEIAEDDVVLLLSFASGLEVGVTIFVMDSLRSRYGRPD